MNGVSDPVLARNRNQPSTITEPATAQRHVLGNDVEMDWARVRPVASKRTSGINKQGAKRSSSGVRITPTTNVAMNSQQRRQVGCRRTASNKTKKIGSSRNRATGITPESPWIRRQAIATTRATRRRRFLRQ